MIYIVYETFLFVPNIRQNAPLDILGSIFFLGFMPPDPTRIRSKHWFHPSQAPVVNIEMNNMKTF